MKIQKLSENMSNLDKVVQNSDINSVTEMPPTMSRAYIDSQDADKATKDIIKPADKVIKEKPFLGASKQPEPKEPEEAKINLDESLFDDANNQSVEIYDFLDECGGYTDYNQKIEDVMEEFDLDRDTAESYVWDWASGLHALEVEEEEDISIGSLKDYVDSIEAEGEAIEESLSLTEDSEARNSMYEDVKNCIENILLSATDNLVPLVSSKVSEYDSDWFDDENQKMYDFVQEAIGNLANVLADSLMVNYKDPAEADWSDETDVEFDESLKQKKLKEDGRSQSLLRQFDDTDIDEEELDLWTQVYSSLINKPDEATWKTMHKKNTVILPKKMRYETINSDADGNIVVYGKTEKDLDGGIKVAKYYNLDYDINPAREVWAKKHPEQRFSLTIKIPEEKVTDIDKYFEG